ncbi:colicin D domain-containing protein [Janthinobacterium sp. HH01]|uniref:colicin D domain-containing protein n=1 Tax=Janthinobacterium sp. HH01 TaxID=1198452 RepID=UPI000A077E09
MALQRHVESPGIQVLKGTFRGMPVTHFLDPASRLNVMRDSNDDFLSAWRLTPMQFSHVIRAGRLGGGP